MQARDSARGRYLVLFADSATDDESADAMRDLAGLRPTRSGDLGARVAVEAASDGTWWSVLGIASVWADVDQVEVLRRAAGVHSPISVVEPERTVYAIGAVAAAPDQRDSGDDATYTWGLEAINATKSEASGRGVRVAVLDTGLDAGHPDLAGRTVVTRSFVEGDDALDVHGHGTHVIGTACGPREPEAGPGYGVAYESEIYTGKVLDDTGAGTDGGILAGIAWAVENDCAVVSLSLGAPVQRGEPYSRSFERAARRAMSRGTLILAAAGNESKRSDGIIAPVGHPANCPSIMAVGAIDRERAVADFSSGTIDRAGAIDVVAPGVDVHSAWPMPERHNTMSGTSMATPHVSGIAALIAQDGSPGPWELWARLSQTAQRLPLPSTDVGAGLVQAP